MTDPMKLYRNVLPDDAAEICRIYNPFVTDTTVSFEQEPLSEEAMRRRIEDIASQYPYIVCEVDGHIAGYCYVHPWKERAAYGGTMETTIYLDDRYKHQGIAKELMTLLIDRCRHLGYHSLIACITADNEESCHFHARLGFRLVSHFKAVGHKFGRDLDVVDYQLIL